MLGEGKTESGGGGRQTDRLRGGTEGEREGETERKRNYP